MPHSHIPELHQQVEKRSADRPGARSACAVHRFDEHLQAARNSRTNSTPLVIHIAETKKRSMTSKQKGATPVKYLENIGFLNEDALLLPILFL
jgi:cytosine/adenosine deaminase-related metal-dependent hydrolase